MSIELVGAQEIAGRLSRMSEGRLRHELAETIALNIPPSTTSVIRSRASRFGRMQAKAAAGTGYAKLPDGVQVTGSGELYAGSEFGGRRRRAQPYITTSRSGNHYIVRRRTTMQFLPYLGETGYAFWPTMRQDLVGIDERLSEKLLEVATGRG